MGISFGYHDSSVAIIDNGEIIVAADEERFSRIKHDNSFPHKSIEFCLDFMGKKICDINKIVYYENPYKKFNRLCDTIKIDEANIFNDILQKWILEEKLDPLKTICQSLNITQDKVTYTDHHLSHAAGAFFSSTLKESAIVTIDGVGEYETITILKAQNNTLKKIKSITLPNSIGMLYSAFTSFLGFEVNEGEYKVMGMASYGSPIYVDKIKKTISIQENGDFSINTDYYNFTTASESHLKEKFFTEFGESRDIAKDFFIKKEDAPSFLSEQESKNLLLQNIYYANLAASLQSITEELIINIIKEALHLTQSNNLCFSGGVALNATANGKIKQFFNLNSFFIQPAAGDSGNALGAALFYTHCILDTPRTHKKFSPFLGKSFTEKDILLSIDNYMISNYKKCETKTFFSKEIAKLLNNNKVIGFFNGRFEFGPRALGHRSIIANPSSSKMKHIVNEKIKFRELFRPFAPSVLKEEAKYWFNIAEPIDENSPENYMIATMAVKKEKRPIIPAVTHIDNTARIQLVDQSNNLYFSVIKEFFKLSNVPMVLNTSFNLKGEPIVNSPEDAIKTFEMCDMDILAMYPYIIYKSREV